jgi:iron complex outermembrane receptor protein
MDLHDDFVLRFAAGKAIARPAPFQLTSAVNLTPETSSGSSGNPELRPLIANQYELGLEWYFQDGSLASATAFSKNIKDFIFTTVSAETIDGQFIARLSRPENGPSAELEGIELSFQHNFPNNFGVAANYTYTNINASPVIEASLVNGEATLVERAVQFPFTSENSYNLTGYYENDTFSARLNYSYRDEFFKANVETGQRWGKEQETLDGQVSYNVTDSLTVRIEALNLTGETIEDIYVSRAGQQFTASQFYNGRRFYVGVNYNFN